MINVQVLTDQEKEINVQVSQVGVGADGDSAYMIWLAAGNTGTETDFLNSLKGEKGDKGDDGEQGPAGEDGADGSGITIKGTETNSAAIIALSGPHDDGDMYIASDTGNGWVWDGSQFVDVGQIRGPQGEKGDDGEQGPAGEDGADGTNGTDGVDGVDGDSAYQIWLAAGNTGTETDFLNSLKGEQGLSGADGTNGTDGTDGVDGDSAYQIWLDAGNTGTETDFLNSLKGEKGDKGDDGEQGPAGVDGTNGSGIIDRSAEKWVIFGDSFSSLDSSDYPYYVVDKLGMNIANCESHALSGNTLQMQNNALDALASDYFDDKDLVTLHIGVNDFATSQLIGKIDRVAARDGHFIGEMKYFIETIQAKNPEIQIYLIAPIKIWQTTNKYDDTNNWGYNLYHYVQAMKDVAQIYSLPVIDLYNNGMINDMNYVDYLDVQYVHPNSTYLPLISDIVADGLSTYNLNYQTTKEIDLEGIRRSKNLFDKSTISESVFISNTGAIGSNAIYNTSDYIPVDEGETYTPNTSIRFSCYFDADGNVVSGGIGSNSDASFTVPAGAVSVRISISVDYLDYFQLELGTETTEISDYWHLDPYYNNLNSKLNSRSMQGAIDEIVENSTPIEDAPTATLTLDNITGRASNFAAANSATTYNIASGPVLFGRDKVLVNAATQPVVNNPDASAARLLVGADFQENTDMYMIVEWQGDTRKADYFFIRIT